MSEGYSTFFGGVGPWLPIESAPKDGTLILVGTPFWYAACRSFNMGRWWTYAPPLYGERPTLDGRAEDPTHWMPLPAPPQDGGREPRSGS